LSQELRVEAQLIKGDNGVFDIVANGNLIFSKHATGRFPEEHEIVEALRPLM
jgi:selT/selW/selH-like putative selenoprotein